MSTLFQIPLGPSQRRMLIALDGTFYNLRFSYADAPEGGWFMDVADNLGNAMIFGIPLVTGVNLLSPYGYLGFVGGLYVSTDGAPDAVPAFDNLGVTSHVYYLSAT